MASVSKREWTSPDGEKKTAWQVRYKDGSKHRSRQFDRKKEAEAFRQKVEREMVDGVHVAKRDTATVEAMCEAFLRVQEDRLRQGAIGRGRLYNLKKAVDHSIVPRLGARTASELKPTDIEEWFRVLVRSGDLSPQTARMRMGDLKLICRHGIRLGYMKVNPVSEAIAEIGRVPMVKVKTFTTEQIGTILRAVSVKPYRTRDRSFHTTRCMVHLATFCGLRLGEIQALRRQHVDLDRGVIEVRHSLTPWNELKGPKSRSGVRDVPIPEHLAEMLREAIQACYIDNEQGFIFTTLRGLPVSDSSFRAEIWYPLLRRVGLFQADTGKQFHFHALRHFAGSFMIANSLALPDVASLLGHSNFDLTLKVYAHSLTTGDSRALALQSMATRLLAPPTIEATALPV